MCAAAAGRGAVIAQLFPILCSIVGFTLTLRLPTIKERIAETLATRCHCQCQCQPQPDPYCEARPHLPLAVLHCWALVCPCLPSPALRCSALSSRLLSPALACPSPACATQVPSVLLLCCSCCWFSAGSISLVVVACAFLKLHWPQLLALERPPSPKLTTDPTHPRSLLTSPPPLARPHSTISPFREHRHRRTISIPTSCAAHSISETSYNKHQSSLPSPRGSSAVSTLPTDGPAGKGDLNPRRPCQNPNTTRRARRPS
ncbi:hypothetical protein N431DRAFT_50426 [Stipitochalara longipes BDJ]|nr:hypothetical protein N431DRAFT_50426 [Stipitochalara longipes BDJ]